MMIYLLNYFSQWTTFHFQWLEHLTLTFNSSYECTINLTLQEILLSDNQLEITISSGFYDCFSNRTNLINNYTVNSLCNNLNCHYRQCIHAFNRGKCLCNYG